jgi:hypothetical protein
MIPVDDDFYMVRCVRTFAIGAAACAVIGVAFAGDPLPSFYTDAGINPFRTTVNQNLEEHIDPFTGMLQLHHTDAVLPGNGHFDLVIHRAFNSPSSSFGSLSDVASYNHTPNVGIGWSLMIGGRLHNYGPGTGSACQGGSGNQMVFETPDGSRQALIRTSIGATDFISAARWKAVCVTGGVQVFAPNGTRYDMTRPIVEIIPNTIQNASFYYPDRIRRP